MLRIRFSRTGKVGQPSFRIVVAEHRAPVKGRALEILGHYMPATPGKTTVIKTDRIAYWISKGATPSDSVASLFKKQKLEGMDKYLQPRTKKRSKKGEEAAAAGAPKPAEAKPAT